MDAPAEQIGMLLVLMVLLFFWISFDIRRGFTAEDQRNRKPSALMASVPPKTLCVYIYKVYSIDGYAVRVCVYIYNHSGRQILGCRNEFETEGARAR